MRVLMVSEPGVDGVFRYVEGLCRHLLEQGVEVHLAYSDRRRSDRLDELVAEVGRRGGATLNLRTGNVPAPADGRALAALARLARGVRPDVIHSHSSKAGALARPLALLGVPAAQVYQPHAYIGMRPGRGRLDFLDNRVERALGRIGCTIVCSSSERAFARDRLGIPPRRLREIRHGVDPAVFRPPDPDERERLRRDFGLPPAAPVLGFLGRSSAQKDPLTLYRAFARAAEVRPDLALFHVGQGELDGELAAAAREPGLAGRVFRVPYLSRPAEFYRAVDGFVLTSRYEGSSLAALEALASGLPLILSEAPGNADLLAEPLSHAWSADPGDVAGFARGIAAWAAELGSGRRVNHRELATARFAHPRQYAAVLELYRSRVRTGSPRP
jgi:glycosyltransferase involved in cell wall biosynthesis